MASVAQATARGRLPLPADGSRGFPGRLAEAMAPSVTGFLLPSRCYCFECVDALAGPGTSGKIQAMSNWVCFLCLPLPRCGLLRQRPKWWRRLKALYDQESVRGRTGASGPSFAAVLRSVASHKRPTCWVHGKGGAVQQSRFDSSPQHGLVFKVLAHGGFVRS